MAKKTKRAQRIREYEDEPPVEERIALALERIADSLEAFEDAAIYDSGDAPFVGVSVNHSADVVGDDLFATVPGDVRPVEDDE